MSATDELRHLLDKRGVEWESKDVEGVSDFHDTRWNAYDVQWCYAEFVGNNYTKLKPSSEFHCTPEQAMAATLGSEFNPDGLPVGLTISDDSNLLNWRGENYVRQSALCGGTCEFVDDSDREPSPPKCNSCGYDPGIYECAWLDDGTYEYERNYCPNCGRKVKR